ADLAAEYLSREGVPADVRQGNLEGGVISNFEVWVSSELAHRARWVLANSEFEDEELDFLATGFIGDDGI
ncbi:MAG: hypothetical protein AAF699_10150, partial [Pseudomonadota bacterium]